MIYTITAALICALGLVGWRVWPVVRGAARDQDSHQVRMEKWNAWLVRLIRRTLEGDLLVARAAVFADRHGALRSMATWSLATTLIPDVEFIALARPDEAGRPRIDAIIPAVELRARLAEHVHENEMWGHQAWIYAWPDDLEYGALVKRLPSIDKFREQHGIAAVGEANDPADP